MLCGRWTQASYTCILFGHYALFIFLIPDGTFHIQYEIIDLVLRMTDFCLYIPIYTISRRTTILLETVNNRGCFFISLSPLCRSFLLCTRTMLCVIMASFCVVWCGLRYMQMQLAAIIHCEKCCQYKNP